MAKRNSVEEQLAESILRIIEDEGHELDSEIEFEAYKFAKFVITQNTAEDEEDPEIEELNFDDTAASSLLFTEEEEE